MYESKMPKLNELKLGHEIGKKSPFQRFIWAACKKCGIPRWVLYVKRTNSPRDLLCVSCGKGRRKGTMSKGYIDKDGYRLISLPWEHKNISNANKQGWILEHRLVMAQHLGRNLLPQEIVHHLNGVKNDNRIENLTLVTRSEHVHLGVPYIQRVQDLERTVKVLEARIKILESNIEPSQAEFNYESCGGSSL